MRNEGITPFDRSVAPVARPAVYDRDWELRAFREALDGDGGAPTRFVVVEGPWGVGKTTFLGECCNAARADGAVVARAAGRAVGQRVRLGILREGFEALLAELSVRGSNPAAGRALAALTAPGPEPDELADALVEAVRAAGIRLLVGVDAADVADADSLGVLGALARWCEPGRVTVVLTAASRLPGVGLRAVDWFLAEPDCRVISLGPLSYEAVGRIVQEVLGANPGAAVTEAVWRATGGRPLFVQALLGAMGRQRPPSATEPERIPQLVSPVLSSAVVTRMARLPNEASQLVEALAVLGDDSAVDLVVALAGADPAVAEAAVDSAMQVELLAPGQPPRFVSPLVRAAVLHEMAPSRRTKLHEQAARLLAGRGADSRLIGTHLLAAKPTGDPASARLLWRCGMACVRAGDRYSGRELLLRALVEPPAPVDLPSVLLDLVDLETTMGRPEALGHFAQVLADPSPRDDQRLAAAAIRLFRSPAPRPDPDPAIVGGVQALVQRLQRDDPARALDLHVAAYGAWGDGSEAALAALEAAVARAGDGGGQSAREGRLLLAEARARRAEAMDVSRLEQVLRHDCDPVGHRVDGLSASVQLDGELAQVLIGMLGADDAALAATDLGSERHAEVIALKSLAALLAGDLARAAAWGAEARSLPGAVDGWAAGVGAACQAAVFLERGEVDRAVALDATLDAAVGGGEPRPSAALRRSFLQLLAADVRARLWAAAGHSQAALDVAVAAGRLADRSGVDNPLLTGWRAEAGLLLAELGNAAEGEPLLARHASLARAFGEPRTLGRALRASAAAASGRARLDLLEEAESVLETSGARLELAAARADLGLALLAGGYREEARLALRTAAHEAALCGALRLVELATRGLRDAGGRPRRVAMTGWEALTPAEARVAALAAAGHTNGSIAAQLYVTQKTVEGHLGRAFRKLAITSRSQLAELVPASAREGEAWGPVGLLPAGPPTR